MFCVVERVQNFKVARLSHRLFDYPQEEEEEEVILREIERQKRRARDTCVSGIVLFAWRCAGEEAGQEEKQDVGRHLLQNILYAESLGLARAVDAHPRGGLYIPFFCFHL